MVEFQWRGVREGLIGRVKSFVGNFYWKKGGGILMGWVCVCVPGQMAGGGGLV